MGLLTPLEEPLRPLVQDGGLRQPREGEGLPRAPTPLRAREAQARAPPPAPHGPVFRSGVRAGRHVVRSALGVPEETSLQG